MSEVIGKNYPVRTEALEAHEKRDAVFSSRNFPAPCIDLPGDGDVLYILKFFLGAYS